MTPKWWMSVLGALLIGSIGWAADSVVTLKGKVALVEQAQSVQSEKNQAVKEVLKEIRDDQRKQSDAIQEVLADIRSRNNNRRP